VVAVLQPFSPATARATSPTAMSEPAAVMTAAGARLPRGSLRSRAKTVDATARSATIHSDPSATSAAESISRSAGTVTSHTMTNREPPTSQPSRPSSTQLRIPDTVPGNVSSADAASRTGTRRSHIGEEPAEAGSAITTCCSDMKAAADPSSHQETRSRPPTREPATSSDAEAAADSTAT